MLRNPWDWECLMFWRATQPLTRWQKIGTISFFLFLLAFGGVVERRSALMERRMGDLDVFLRAAWAVRTGGDLYAVTSDNGWHYIYPPLYAIFLTPLADPPLDADHTGYLPYAISVAICYLLNVICLLFAAHVLASALEDRADDAEFRDQPRFCLRWWTLRLWPILICFPPIGHTLVRGQVNVIILATLCAALARLDSRAELPGRALACPGDFDQGDPRVPVGVPDLEAGLARVGRLFRRPASRPGARAGNRVRTGGCRRPLRNLWPGLFRALSQAKQRQFA